ncbi:MAG: DUF4185 domain-containing protein [Steroidobacteraceae bacterium]
MGGSSTFSRLIITACALGATLAGPSQADVTAGKTVVLGPFVGQNATKDRANLEPLPIEFYGTDLGFSYEHKGRLHFLFGDTSAHETGEPIEKSNGGKFDDSFGSIDLARWNSPETFGPGHLPPVLIGQNPGSTETAAIDPGQPLEVFKTPIGGFSNGVNEFGVFFTFKPLGCQADAQCPHHSSCDTGLGDIGKPWTEQAGLTLFCVDGSPGCRNDTLSDAKGKPVPNSGLCVDRTSSNWQNTARGRIDGVVVQLLIGTRDTTVPKRYHTDHSWYTRKFMNSEWRTVRAFDEPGSAGAAAPDYRWADHPASRSRVFIWGRPHFVGFNAANRTLSAYFAYVDLPRARGYAWNPRFFAGLDAKGQPRFSSREDEAKPLDLDSTQPGVQAAESTDMVDQVSVAWVPALAKWVMLYGGGVTTLPIEPGLKKCGVLELFIGPECSSVNLGNGAIRMRTADAPWGPWSPSQDVLVAGDPSVPAKQYGPGGVLYQKDCKDPSCAQPTRQRDLHPNEYGFLYAPNIIEQWSRATADGADIYWNVSTWDPYRIVLVRTHLKR